MDRIQNTANSTLLLFKIVKKGGVVSNLKIRCEDIENSHDFSKIPESSRVKLYYINRDKEAMEQVKEKVNNS